MKEITEFTEQSPALNLPAAVRFAKEHNSVLQSLQDAVATCLEARCEDGTPRKVEYNVWTRTAALCVPDGKKVYIAFDDHPAESQNIILARADECYKMHSHKQAWVLPEKDRHVAAALKRARKSGRFAELDYGALKSHLNDMDITDVGLKFKSASGVKLPWNKIPRYSVARAALQDLILQYALSVKERNPKLKKRDGDTLYWSGHADATFYLAQSIFAKGTVEVWPVSMYYSCSRQEYEKYTREYHFIRPKGIGYRTYNEIYLQQSADKRMSARGIYKPTEWRK